MDTLSDTLLKLVNNPIDVFEGTCTVLIKIADNVLRDPSNMKVRTLNKANQTVKKKILSVPGGVECLKLMGFQEDENLFKLSLESSLNRLEKVKTEIEKFNKKSTDKTKSTATVSESPKVKPDSPKVHGKSSGAVRKNKEAESTAASEKAASTSCTGSDIIKKLELPPFHSIFNNAFLKEIEWNFHLALVYENTELQKRAKKLIPLTELETKAAENLRILQEQIKRGKLKDPEIALQDMLILELLSWFKNDFFTWVDSPDCSFCGGKTKFSHMSEDKNLLVHTERVEMHKCSACHTLTPFPRYSDLNILLETRKGRCGEWAKSFTLLCRSIGWDARFVIDTTDHVWTEVFSHSQKRWLHCDPCENACDTPLIYEVGWKKSLSYIIAYSGEDIQDVTWRYSCNHKEVLKRRRRCPEEELIIAIIKLRSERQKNFSKARKDYLIKRLLNEMVELMTERKPSEKDNLERISGSLNWKLSRGEAHQDSDKSYTWIFTADDIENNCFTLKYSSSTNTYELCKGKDSEKMRTVNGWDNGVFESKGVFRKVENDWKMVYICRQEKVEEGVIKWRFQIDEKSGKVFDEIELTIHKTTFENGSVTASLSNGEVDTELNTDGSLQVVKQIHGSKELLLTTKLLGETNNNSWQHSQLFRESLDSENYSFIITFKLIDN